MSAVHNDEHDELTKTSDVEETHVVINDATPQHQHSEEVIPSATHSEHIHSLEEHVTTSQAVEGTANESSSDDTRGEATLSEHEGEVPSVEVPVVALKDTKEAQSDIDREAHTNTTIEIATESNEEGILETRSASDLSYNVNTSEAVEPTTTSNHEIEVTHAGAASEAVVTSALMDVQTLTADRDEEPIILEENALEVCEAEPDVLPSSTASAEGLWVLKENASETCEAEPVIVPSPGIPFETLVQPKPSAPEPVAEQSRAVDVSPVHDDQVASTAAAIVELHSAQVAHEIEPVPDVQSSVTEGHPHEIPVESEHGDGTIVPHTQEIAVEESEKREVLQEEVPRYAASHVDERDNNTEDVNVTHLEHEDEPSVAIVQPVLATQEALEVEEAVLTTEATESSFDAKEATFANVDVLSPTDAEHLVLLSSSSETCLAEPQVDDELEQRSESAPVIPDQIIQAVPIVTEVEDLSTIVSAPAVPIAADEPLVEHDTSTSVEEHVMPPISREEEVQAAADEGAEAEPAVQQSLSNEQVEPTPAGVEEPDVVGSSNGQEVAKEPAAVEETQTSFQIDAKDVEATATLVDCEDVVAETVETIHEQRTETQDIAETGADVATESVHLKTQMQENMLNAESEAVTASEQPDDTKEASASASQTATTGLTLLIHEEATVCEAGEPESVNQPPPEIIIPSETQEIEEATTPIIAITSEGPEELSVQAESAPVDNVPDAENERPSSPWTPSYSVTTQGPGAEIADDSEELAALEKLSPVDEQKVASEAEIVSGEPGTSAVEVAASAVSTTEDTSNGWSLSYSVSSQGASPAQTPQEAEIEQLPVKTATEEIEAPHQEATSDSIVAEVPIDVPQTETETGEQSIEPPIIVTPDELEISISDIQSRVEESVEERPSERPWTPSYAVTQQGSSPSQTPKELEAESDVIAEQSVTISSTDEPQPALEKPERPWTPSYSIAHVGASPSFVARDLAASLEQVEATVPVIVAAAAAVEPSAEDKVQTQQVAESSEPPEAPERPWTPSYAVSQQGGSPLLAPKDLEESPLPEPPADVPAAVEFPEEIAAPRPWTPSYSVSQQGASPTVASQSLDATISTQLPADQPPALVVTEEISPDHPSNSVSEHGTSPFITSKELEVSSPTASLSEVPVANEEITPPERPWTPSYSVSRQGSSPQLVAAEPVDAESAEIPPRPWTPSYSVSRQGSSPLPKTQELPQVTADVSQKQPETETAPEKPQILVIQPEDVAVPEVPVTDNKTSTWAASYSVSQQGTSPVGSPATHSKELDSLELAVNTTEDIAAAQTGQPSVPEKPQRSWSASYAVTTQGSSSPALGNGAQLATETSLQAFPTTETADNAPISKPALARLAPVDEYEQATMGVTSELEAVSPTGRRARLESTTSSRFFPGGWFSGNSKSPEENRTSLDHATGVFSRLENVSTSPAIDAPANTPVEGDPGRKRWCLVM